MNIFNQLKSLFFRENISNLENVKNPSSQEKYNIDSFLKDISKMNLNEKKNYLISINKKINIEGYKINSDLKNNIANLQIQILKEYGFDTSNSFDDAFDYGDRAIAKAELNDPLGSIFDFDKAISIYPDYESAYLWRGEEKIKIKDYKGAFKDFEFTLKINPKNENALSNLEFVKLKIENK